MLSSLHIENIAVIKRCDIDFFQGLSVLTGQTGAGKSVIIGSIELLCGGRFSKDALRTGEQVATVAASFEQLSTETLQKLAALGFEEDTFYMQRTVQVDGKSQTRCNGRIIPLSLHRQIMACLVHIHGQHDNEAFLSQAAHLSYLDAYAQTENLLSAYRENYDAMRKLAAKRAALERDAQEKARMEELYAYQIQEIDAVNPQPEEEQCLQAQRKRLQNAAHIEKSARLIRRALYRNEKGLSAFDLMEKAAQALQGLDDVMENAAAYAETVNNYRYELAEIAQAVSAYAVEDEEDPAQQLDRIEERLDALARLKRKYGADIQAVLHFRAHAHAELRALQHADTLIEEYDAQLQQLRAQTFACGEALHAARQKAALSLQMQMEQEFSYLDMEKVHFSVEVSKKTDANGAVQPGEDGLDTVCFMISSNPGEPYKPLAKIASGGELARVMLAAKSVLHANDGATMIFDEVDSGVSGATSHKIGVKMRALGHLQAGSQVLCVTHSAQIAAMADAQYLIEKRISGGRTFSGVSLLDETNRTEELARIIAGSEITQAARESAKALLLEARSGK